MPSHDLYNTQILPVINKYRYSNHFVEYVDCNYTVAPKLTILLPQQP